MNKDNVAASMLSKNTGSILNKTSFTINETYGKLPFGFDTKNVSAWIDSRKASNHNAHLKALMQRLHCYDTEGFINITHAATINDTFWIKSENEKVTWTDISLYRNQFTETISQSAFEGVGLCDMVFSATSPELSSEGSFPKCFRKEQNKGQFGSDIYIYKRGSDIGQGIESYCERLASEIAAIVSPQNYVNYELVNFNGKITSCCNLFTNETEGFASFARLSHQNSIQTANGLDSYDTNDAFEFFSKIGSEQEFREMLVIDAVSFNTDRHFGNFGVLFNNDTLDIIKMSPVFDLNLTMLSSVDTMDLTINKIGDALYEYLTPKLGDDFTRIGQLALNDVIKERIKDLTDFSFTFRGDDTFSPERVKKLEEIVRIQASAILSKDVLHTKDVFISQKAEAELTGASNQNNF